MSDRHDISRFIVSMLVAGCVFAVMNYFILSRRGLCADCFVRYGWPITFMEGES